MNPWLWIETLGRASLEGAVLILAVWTACRLWPGLPAWARSGLWWLASARLLIALLPLAHVSVRAPLPVTAVWWPAALAAAPPAAEPPPAIATAPPRSLLGEPITGASVAPPYRGPVVVAPRPARPWDPRIFPTLLLVVWGGGVGVRALGLTRQFRRVRRVMRTARPLDLDRQRVPAPGGVRFAVSPEAPVPMVTGLLRPTVLVPVAMLGQAGQTLELAVAHELAHARRGDLWMAWAPALAETLFWFHPLVPWCAREYVLACEEACDEQALRDTGASPYDYGRLLLAFGVHPRLAGATAIPCGSPSPRQLMRRLSMLKPVAPLKPHARNAAAGLLCAFALVGLAPLRVVPTTTAPAMPQGGTAAASVVPADPLAAPGAVESETASRAAEGPAAVVPTEAASEVMSAERSAPALAGESDDEASTADEPEAEDADPDLEADEEWETPPTPPTPPTARRAARAPRAPKTALTPMPRLAPLPALPQGKARRPGFAMGYDSGRDRFAYVVVHPDEDNFSGSGNAADWREVRRLRNKIGHDFLWVRTGGDRYLVDSPELMARVDEALQPQRELGERQSRLGEAQSQIGEKQSEIGQQQSEIGQRQSEVGERQAEIAEALAERRASGQKTRQLERMAEDLSARMEDLSREQERLAAEMEPLSREMERLGEQMGGLGRQMEQVSRQAERRVRALIDEAIRDGSAKPLR